MGVAEESLEAELALEALVLSVSCGRPLPSLA